MVDGNYRVYKKNWIWAFPAILFPQLAVCATTLGPFIFMPLRYFTGSMSEGRKRALYLREAMHIKQWRKEGILYLLKWVFFKTCRRVYEMEAYRIQIEELLRNKEDINIDKFAVVISFSYGPFGFVNIGEAKEFVNRCIFKYKYDQEKLNEEESK